MTRRRIPSVVLALLSGLLLGSVGCSLTREGSDCESTSECTEAFGPGTICTAAGLCEPAPLEPTCQNQFPTDLLFDRQKYKGWTILGSLLRATRKEGARNDAAELALGAVDDFFRENDGDYPELEGMRFGLIECSHDGSVKEVERLATYLTGTLQVDLILGPASSSSTNAAFRKVNLQGEEEETRAAVFISPSATSVALTDLESTRPGVLWRTAPTDDGQGRLMGAYATDQDMALAVFYEDTPYGRGLHSELARSAPDLCDDCGIPFDATDEDTDSLSKVLTSNRARDALAEATIVMFMGAQEKHIQFMVKEFADGRFGDKTLFFSDAAANADIYKNLTADVASRILGTRASLPPDTEIHRFFELEYEDRFEESPGLHSFTANSYDATWMLMLGAIWSRITYGDVSVEGAAEGISKLNDKAHADLDENQCPVELIDKTCPELNLDAFTLPAMIQSFTRGRGIDVVGASGRLEYCPREEELERDINAFELWELTPSQEEEGRYEIVTSSRPTVLRETPPPCPAD